MLLRAGHPSLLLGKWVLVFLFSLQKRTVNVTILVHEAPPNSQCSICLCCRSLLGMVGVRQRAPAQVGMGITFRHHERRLYAALAKISLLNAGAAGCAAVSALTQGITLLGSK
jgi:hypothetical protein